MGSGDDPKLAEGSQRMRLSFGGGVNFGSLTFGGSNEVAAWVDQQLKDGAIRKFICGMPSGRCGVVILD
jgi:hypothetical protein